MSTLRTKSAALALLLVVAGCGSTGGGIVAFTSMAAGPADAPGGGTLSFTNGFGFDVTLTKATLHVGSLYLNENAQASISMAASCIEDGIYVAEELSSLDVDLLDPTPQPFPIPGNGIAQPALQGQVWLNGMVDVNQIDDPTQVLVASGTATKGGMSWPFQATVTISENRAPPVANPALPGEADICTERIIAGIGVMLTPSNSGTLLLRADPRQIFGAVKFDSLMETSTSPPLYAFQDNNVAPADVALFLGLTSSGSYQFTFEP
jgi:hypothetical protein